MVCLLVAEAVQRDARAAIRDIVAEYPGLWTDAQLRNLAHKMVASRIDWRRGFDGERTSFYDSMQRIYTDDGHGGGRLALHVTRDQNLFQLLNSIASGGSTAASMFSNTGVATFALPAVNLVVASRKPMTDMFDKVTNEALARLDTPFWQRASMPSLEDEVSALRSEPLGQYHYLFVLLLTPACDKFLNRVAGSDADRDGVFLGLALELYHREHRQWPQSLDQLSPQWLPAVPLDPITGKPLHYQVVNDRPIVYSVGIDGDDDGGRVPVDTAGKPDASLATPVGTTAMDGDWVLWTTMITKPPIPAQGSPRLRSPN
jgi:hypothetical protein